VLDCNKSAAGRALSKLVSASVLHPASTLDCLLFACDGFTKGDGQPVTPCPRRDEYRYCAAGLPADSPCS